MSRTTQQVRILEGNARHFSITRWMAAEDWDNNNSSTYSIDPEMIGNQQFYRKPLPPECISFCSSAGREVFGKAIGMGHMVCYFNLASQFRTQDEPAFCGLSTLVMVLNALSVDPGRVWKSPWRWYHEGMLDCCVPIHVAAKQGITLDQFTCIAQCNSLQVKTTRVTPNESLRTFRKLVLDMTTLDDKVLVCSYSRLVLGQTGDGHFSPIGGYYPDEDLVLLLDVARFKYPPHWVKLTLLWKAMSKVDTETGLPRGYCVMERFDSNGPPLLFTIAPPMGILFPKDILPEIRAFVRSIEKWHAKNDGHPQDLIIPEAIRAFFDILLNLPEGVSLLSTEINLRGYLTSTVSVDHAHKIMALIAAIEETEVYEYVGDFLELKGYAPLKTKTTGKITTCTTDCSKTNCTPFFDDYNDQNTVKLYCNSKQGTTLTQRHFLAVLVLASSFSRDKSDVGKSNGFLLAKVVNSTLNKAPVDLQTEVRQLRRQLRTCIAYIGATTH